MYRGVVILMLMRENREWIEEIGRELIIKFEELEKLQNEIRVLDERVFLIESAIERSPEDSDVFSRLQKMRESCVEQLEKKKAEETSCSIAHKNLKAEFGVLRIGIF